MTVLGLAANLLEFMILASPKLGSRALRAGDEVTTLVAGFPTMAADWYDACVNRYDGCNAVLEQQIEDYLKRASSYDS
ncbi:MAG: hypothetical protein QMB16_01715 [Paracoccaceae bacterium]